MVGVPGRSKGCNTCIQRKVKCDQEALICGNCRKSNRLCTGYKRRLGYVLSHDMSLTDLADPTSSREETTVTYQGRWRRTRTKPHQPLVAAHQVAEAPPTWAGTPHYFSLCRQIPSSTAFRQQFHYIFLNDHLPTEMLDNGLRKSEVSMNWLLQLRDVVIQSPALETSIAAFFAAQVGRNNNDMNLVYQSRSMYVGALETLQRALSNSKTRLSDETLAACMALCLYELTECPAGTPKAYITHQKGSMTLLQLRGPDASASPLGHSLFLGLRAQTITGSLLQRRETFLSRPEWIERPWKLLPKAPIDELFDQLFDVPAIFQQFDKISLETSQAVLQDGVRDIITKCLKVEFALRSLFGNFEKSVSGPLYWPQLSVLESPLDSMRLGKVFPVSFYFPAFMVARVLTTYWSSMMVVHYQLMYAYDKLAAIESPTSLASTNDSLPESASAGTGLYSTAPFNILSREHSNKWISMARNICQSVEYFLQDKMQGLGPIIMLGSLQGCKSCLESAPEDCGREISWITEILERIQKKFYFPIKNILED